MNDREGATFVAFVIMEPDNVKVVRSVVAALVVTAASPAVVKR
jgi:hypothetical protein